jgi:NHL repeat
VTGPQVLAEKTGTFYGQPMKAGLIYNLFPTPASRTNLYPLALDHAGNIVVASGEPNDIAVIAVKAGTFCGIRMRPEHVYNVAPGTSLGYPSGIAVDAAGNVLIADTPNNRVKVLAERSCTFYRIRVRAGQVYTVAGGGQHGLGDGGPATGAELSSVRDRALRQGAAGAGRPERPPPGGNGLRG